MSYSYFHAAGELHGHGSHHGVPTPGQIIGWWKDRRAYRVIQVDEREFANWAESTVSCWHRAKEPDPATWDGRERVLLVEPARHPAPDGRDRKGLRVFPWAWGTDQWIPLEDPYPVCVDCGRLWPCPCHDANVEATKATTELDRLSGILPGCCWACGKPIEGRQHYIVFDGENLLLPGGGPVAMHTSGSSKAGRTSCRQMAAEYEERWVAASPGRRRRLSCLGTLWRHIDRYECTAGDCPGSSASHDAGHYCTTAVFGAVDHTGHADEFRPGTRCDGLGCRGLLVAASREGSR